MGINYMKKEDVMLMKKLDINYLQRIILIM